MCFMASPDTTPVAKAKDVPLHNWQQRRISAAQMAQRVEMNRPELVAGKFTAGAEAQPVLLNELIFNRGRDGHC